MKHTPAKRVSSVHGHKVKKSVEYLASDVDEEHNDPADNESDTPRPKK